MRELIERMMDKQIASQVEGKYVIRLTFGDNITDPVSLYDQDGSYFLEPFLGKAKKITKADFRKIIGMSNLKIGGDVREGKGKTKMTYDEFFNRYYNKK